MTALPCTHGVFREFEVLPSKLLYCVQFRVVLCRDILSLDYKYSNVDNYAVFCLEIFIGASTFVIE